MLLPISRSHVSKITRLGNRTSLRRYIIPITLLNVIVLSVFPFTSTTGSFTSLFQRSSRESTNESTQESKRASIIHESTQESKRASIIHESTQESKRASIIHESTQESKRASIIHESTQGSKRASIIHESTHTSVHESPHEGVQDSTHESTHKSAHSNSPYEASTKPYQLSYLQQDVRNVTRATYGAYLEACLGRDEFNPHTNECHDWFNVGLTLLDSLDTLHLMDLQTEYKASRKWAAQSLSFRGMQDSVSMFEVVIRALGGLNSAYILTHDNLWRTKAIELADVLLPAFNLSITGCPPMNTFIGQALQKQEGSYDSYTSAADAGTLQLEMRTVSKIAGNSVYARAADKCMSNMLTGLRRSGNLRAFFNINTGVFSGERRTIGGGVDSLYEMMMKTWIASGKRAQDADLSRAFDKGIADTFQQLVRVSPHGLLYVGERYGSGNVTEQMDHLACFLPGVLAVAAMNGLGGGVNGEDEEDYIPRARRLAQTCYEMTRGMPHGLASEITLFSDEWHRKPKISHDHALLRPEIVESLYYLDLIDPKAGNRYKKWGKQMWESIRKNAQAPGRADGVLCSWVNLKEVGREKEPSGKLHSFVIAETLKYFYLLFDERGLKDSPFPLDRWVFNTEAHPVLISS